MEPAHADAAEKMERAVAALSAATAFSPTHTAALFNLGTSELKRRKYPQVLLLHTPAGAIQCTLNSTLHLFA